MIGIICIRFFVVAAVFRVKLVEAKEAVEEKEEKVGVEEVADEEVAENKL